MLDAGRQRRRRCVGGFDGRAGLPEATRVACGTVSIRIREQPASPGPWRYRGPVPCLFAVKAKRGVHRAVGRSHRPAALRRPEHGRRLLDSAGLSGLAERSIDRWEASGVEFPIYPPPGIVILLAGALFVELAPWRSSSTRRAGREAFRFASQAGCAARNAHIACYPPGPRAHHSWRRRRGDPGNRTSTHGGTAASPVAVNRSHVGRRMGRSHLAQVGPAHVGVLPEGLRRVGQDDLAGLEHVTTVGDG
jgi:hypothetical protein